MWKRRRREEYYSDGVAYDIIIIWTLHDDRSSRDDEDVALRDLHTLTILPYGSFAAATDGAVVSCKRAVSSCSTCKQRWRIYDVTTRNVIRDLFTRTSSFPARPLRRRLTTTPLGDDVPTVGGQNCVSLHRVDKLSYNTYVRPTIIVVVVTTLHHIAMCVCALYETVTRIRRQRFRYYNINIVK